VTVPLNTSHGAVAVRPFRDSLLAMLGIALVNMLVALDQTVVSTALPSILSELQGFQYYAWMASAYLLASVVTVPIFGRLGDYFGRKPFVVAAVITFTAASVLCGIAPSMLTLVLARGLQGVGGGMMVGTAFASIPDLFPDPRARVRWQVVMAGAYGIGTAAGPSLGGFLSEHYGWRSTFLVNLPVGLAGLYCVVRYLPNFKRAVQGKVRIDWLGAALLTIALACLQMCVEDVPRRGLDTGTLVLIVTTLVSGAAFIACERRALHPIVPLGLFDNSKLVVLFTLSMLAGVAMFSLIFFAPLLLQGGFDMSPQQAGLIATPLPVCIAAGSLLNSHIVVRLKKPTTILSAGFLLLLVACLGVAMTYRYTPLVLLEIALGCGGVGLGFVLNNMNIFVQEIAGRENFGIATALMQSTRMVGGMIGTAAVGTIVARSYARGVGDALEHLTTASNAAQWSGRLSDPQVLIDAGTRAMTLTQLAEAGIDGPEILNLSRQLLVGSIHTGVLFVAMAIAAAVMLVRRIPDVTLHAKPQRTVIDSGH
jgi:EmrB/QacA subfamily drug resistance transporter